MSCYGCLRDTGHEAECPNEGVYAKRAGRVFYGVDLGTADGTAVSTFRKESDGRLTLIENKLTLQREAPKTELRFLGTESFTLPTPTPGKTFRIVYTDKLPDPPPRFRLVYVENPVRLHE